MIFTRGNVRLNTNWLINDINLTKKFESHLGVIRKPDPLHWQGTPSALKAFSASPESAVLVELSSVVCPLAVDYKWNSLGGQLRATLDRLYSKFSHITDGSLDWDTHTMSGWNHIREVPFTFSWGSLGRLNMKTLPEEEEKQSTPTPPGLASKKRQCFETDKLIPRKHRD